MGKKRASILFTLLFSIFLSFSATAISDTKASDIFTDGEPASDAIENYENTGTSTTLVSDSMEPIFDAGDYSDFTSIRDILFDPDSPDVVEASASSVASANNIAKAGLALRAGMVARKQYISIPITLSAEGDNETLRNVEKAVYKYALEETSKGNEGDYLVWDIHDSLSGGEFFPETKVYMMTFIMYYKTTADMESKTTAAINQALSNMKITGSNVSTYSKILHIYDYICTKVSYNKNSYQSTAYGAIVNNKAVCQGIALLFYRMAKQCGINCRVVYSTTHMWNLVGINGKYYNVDATHDLLSKGASGVSHFLLTDSAIANLDSLHIREAGKECSSASFMNSYPTSSTNYRANLKTDVPTVTSWTNMSNRRQGKCNSCGLTLYAAKTTCINHSFVTTKAPTYSTKGSKCCSICGLSAAIAKKTLSAPTNVVAQSLSGHRIRLTWNEVKDATGYNIYRKYFGKTTYTRVATLKSGSTSYLTSSVTPGNSYYYCVKAYVTENGKNYWSPVSAKRVVTARPDAPILRSTTKYNSHTEGIHRKRPPIRTPS